MEECIVYEINSYSSILDRAGLKEHTDITSSQKEQFISMKAASFKGIPLLQSVHTVKKMISKAIVQMEHGWLHKYYPQSEKTVHLCKGIPLCI